MQTQVTNLLTKLIIMVMDSTKEQLMPQLNLKETLLSLGQRNMQTTLLQEICVEIENARAFTTNEIAKP